MEKQFYIGNYKKEAKRKGGWFIGGDHFMTEDDLRKDNRFEVKYWEFAPGKTEHETKMLLCATELTIILRGKIDGTADKEKIILETGDYILIPPKVENGFPENVFEYVEGLTIKIPSVRDDKVTGDKLAVIKEIIAKK